MVAVPELPADPTFYASAIADAGYFEAVQLTSDDIARRTQYAANSARQSAAAQTTDLDGYLKSLEMVLKWGAVDAPSLKRAVQLTNKTNQFNLTTRRITDAEMAEICSDRHSICLQFRLIDKFGDNGLISIITGRLDPGSGQLEIDRWLMSCRVLGRGVENAALQILADQSRALGAVSLRGRYVPSAKNNMVRDHYMRLGFTLLEGHGDAGADWLLNLENALPASLAIKIEKE